MPRSDRTLRRLIADLAGLHPDDLARVLDDLDVQSRAKANALLKEFAGEPDAEHAVPEPALPTTAPVPTAGYDLRAMSPWMKGLLRENSAARSTMTAAAFAALCDSAATVHAVDGKKKKRPGLFSRRRPQPIEQVTA